MRHRKLLILIIFLVAVAAVAGVVYYRMARPGRAVLLLPDGDVVIYADLAPIPFVNVGQFIDVDQLPGQSDPEYRDFITQTNFHVERDLKTIAISIRNPSEANPELAAVFTGKFDLDGLRTYMQGHSTGSESYAGKTIFSVRGADHLVRACLVDSSTVAVTNTDSADSIHSIIDKATHSYRSGEAPPLVRDYYNYVPFGSLGWAMLRVPAQNSQFTGGMKMDFLQNAVAVISVRYTGSVRIRADVISANQADAAKVLEAFNQFLAFGRAAAESLGSGPDKDVKAVFDRIQVEQKGNETIVNVVIPQEVVKKVGQKMSQAGPRSD
ncbi:MAG TPA: hypothetical protein VJA94_04910 [Candidatus Angelobacter sp.]